MSPKPTRTRVWAKVVESVSPSLMKKTTPPPSREQLLKDENWSKSQEIAALRLRLDAYNTAVRSVVMRLKVLDIDKLKEEMGEDGTIPMRMMLRELAALVEVYDGTAKADYSDSPSPTPSPGF
jgi:hypothetical protein